MTGSSSEWLGDAVVTDSSPGVYVSDRSKNEANIPLVSSEELFKVTRRLRLERVASAAKAYLVARSQGVDDTVALVITLEELDSPV